MEPNKDPFLSDFYPDSDLEEEHSDSDGEDEGPRINTWHDVHPSNVSFSINNGRKKAFDRAKSDIEHVVERIKELSGVEDPTTADVMDIFFGEKALFTQTLARILGLENDRLTLWKFLQTFVMQNILTKDTTNFYSIIEESFGMEVPNAKVPMTKAEYEAIWFRLADYGRNRNGGPDATRPTPGWEKLQKVLNEIFRSIVIEGRMDTICIVIDDDKIWLDNTGANAEDRFKLKIVRHVNDNENGLNAHSVVTAGFLLPTNIQFEMNGDSPMGCFRRAISELVPLNSNGQLSTHNMESFTDRGYTDKKQVEESAKGGGDVVCTVKRQKDWGFTYDQILKAGDKRKLVTTKGCASQHVKQQKIGQKTLTLCAFNNGTGSVSLAASTTHEGHSWEGIPLKDNYQLPNQFDFLSTIYFNEDLESTDLDAKIAMLDYLNDRLLFYTIQQGTSDWHLLRKFSFSSSQAWTTFNASFQDLHNNQSGVKLQCEHVARLVRGPTWENAHLALHEQVGGNIIDISQEENAFLEYMKALSEEPFDEQASPALQFIHETYNQYIRNDEVILDKKQAGLLVTEKLPNAAHVRIAHEKLRSRVCTTLDEVDTGVMRKEIIDFLSSSNKERKYMFHKHSSLLSTCSKYGTKSVKASNRENTLRRRLVEYESDENNSTTLPIDATTAKERQKSRIEQLLKQSFQINFKGARKAACMIGHRNEPTIVKYFAKDANSGLLPGVKRVLAVFTTGLVAKRDSPYIKDSIDALAIIEKDDENSSNELWGIEVKSRVATDEISKEMKFQRKRHNLDSHLSKIYSETNEEEFHADIRKLTERTQILHHASVFNLTKMMFLVGDCDGRIIHGNAITFSEATLTNYGSTLDVMYNDTLSWAYKDVIDPNSSEFKRVSVIAANIPTIGGKDEFHSQFFLWKHMSTKEKLPLPPLKRLIPSIHATWNAFKSGSDTTTALMENHRFKHPHTNCNSRASSRLLLLAFVFIHRSLQAVTCDPDRHETLQQLRDAASKRYSFPKTLQCLLTYFENKVSTCRQENAGVPIVDYTIPTRTSRRLNAPLLLYVTPRTFDTPKYNHKSERNRRPDGSEYWNRILKCRQTGGFGVFAQYIGNRKEKTRPFRCWSCQKETHHMCFICRRPLCHTRIVVKDLEDLLAQEDAYKLQPFTKKDQSDPNLFWYGVKTCFMKEHMHTIEER